MKKKEHKSKSLLWRLSLVLLALVLSINLMAQTITQTGVVVDQNNEPMIGVTVQTKGTVTGGITDLDGNFTIKCNKGATLVFSFMGYKTVEHKANGQRMKIEMAEDAQALDEVVIVGLMHYKVLLPVCKSYQTPERLVLLHLYLSVVLLLLVMKVSLRCML